jgi:geranylgeranyl reductase family protein
MNQFEVDVLIVGGGPSGLYAAGRLARRGVRVLVCEEHDRVGDPVHCTGILATESFAEFNLPRESSLNDLASARFVSPAGIVVSYATASPMATVIDRPAFDRALAARATAAGATITTRARVANLETDREGVRAFVGDRLITARLAIIACGASYALQRRSGLGLPFLHLQTAQAEVPAATPPPAVDVRFGRKVAPDGFAWVVPVERPGGCCVRIGAMASTDALGAFRRLFDSVRAAYGLPEPPAPRQKILPLGTIKRTHADRLLVVGDAAGLVKPTTGGGIYYSIVSAELASETAFTALDRDELDRHALARYERAWRRRLGDEIETQTAMRQLVTQLSDQEIDNLFDLARTDGILPIVRATAKFNQHRHLIRALFRHPPARRILFRAAVG